MVCRYFADSLKSASDTLADVTYVIEDKSILCEMFDNCSELRNLQWLCFLRQGPQWCLSTALVPPQLSLH